MSRAPDVGVVLVHHHTPDLVAECVEALRADLAAAAITAEWLLVDNGSEPPDRAGFEDLGLRRIDPGENLGYAGGLNRGVAEATADNLLLMNPDVLVRPGCTAALLAALEAGAGAAGPRFYWDRGRRLVLPPNEPRRRRWELRASLALAGGAAAERARQIWRLHARRQWLAREPFLTFELSGALLAVTRRAWNRVGPFDDGYKLYFEETDWLYRLRRAGLSALHLPSAEAVHLYDRSASREPRASAWFEASRRRFFDRQYGAWFRWLTVALERRLDNAAEPATEASAREACSEAPRLELPPERPLWVELSPRAAGFPAAAERLTEAAGAWTLPHEVWARLSPGTYWLRVVGQDGRELLCRGVRKAALAQPPATGR